MGYESMTRIGTNFESTWSISYLLTGFVEIIYIRQNVRDWGFGQDGASPSLVLGKVLMTRQITITVI